MQWRQTGVLLAAGLLFLALAPAMAQDEPVPSTYEKITLTERHDADPAVSPDGKTLAFASDRSGNYDIWIMNSDGSKKVQLTTYSKDERQPFWATDGKIYFVVTEKVGTSNIYALKAPKD